MIRARSPPVGVSAKARAQHERREPAGKQRHAHVVDLVLHGDGRNLEHRADHDQRNDPERQVDVEDPPPGEMVDEEPADQRADHRGDAEHGSHEPGVTAPLPRRHDVADDRLGRDHQRAAAEALDSAKCDQGRHPRRSATEAGPDEEQHERDLQDDLSPVEVAELARDRRRDRRGEQVRGHDP